MVTASLKCPRERNVRSPLFWGYTDKEEKKMANTTNSDSIILDWVNSYNAFD